MHKKLLVVVSKSWVDDRNQIGGGSLQPAKESHNNYITGLRVHYNNI